MSVMNMGLGCAQTGLCEKGYGVTLLIHDEQYKVCLYLSGASQQ